jgi:hypothetical protein
VSPLAGHKKRQKTETGDMRGDKRTRERKEEQERGEEERGEGEERVDYTHSERS